MVDVRLGSLVTEDEGDGPAVVLVHGGPVAMPDDAEYILRNTRTCHGFYGASSMERLVTEVAMTEQTRAFKRMKSR